MKIIVTGGHPTPAFAFIEALKQKYPSIEVVFVGRKYALEGDSSLSFEYKEAERMKLRFYNLSTGKFIRSISLNWLKNLYKIFLGFWQSFFILRKEKPSLVFSFGGYLAFPVAFWAFLLRIPLYTHEQTSSLGLANLIIGFFAKRVFVAFEEVKLQFPFFLRKKVIVSGNPVRRGVFFIKKKIFSIPSKAKAVIFVLGGSLGSHSLNKHIFNILPKLLEKNYFVVHQIGGVRKYKDYQTAENLKRKLPKEARSLYFFKEHFSEDEIGYIFKKAKLLISRSGANTFFEIIRLGIPAVLVPLPWSAGREQLKHAQILEKAGAGEIFNQNKKSQELLKLIEKVLKNYNKYKESFKNIPEKYKLKGEDVLIKYLEKDLSFS